MDFTLIETFTKELPADSNTINTPRQVLNSCFSYVNPRECSNPELLIVSTEMMEELNLKDSESKEFLDVFSGSKVYEGTKSYAMCYGGHQFGNWAGQLGDGRAINLFEVKGKSNNWAIQLKGSGATPYSRTADGLAVLRSSVREFLASEAMYALGVPTTRALSLMLTGDQVLRDMLYDGNPAYEKGAVVCRMAESFVRFGSVEIFASRRDLDSMQKLLDYTIRNFYTELGEPSVETYVQLMREVATKTLDLILDWERVGFVHGVMNTDNLSILGLTIDYGPYGWLDDYNPDWTPNTTDAQQSRYRYGNQAQIGLWNLAKLANAMYPLIEDAKPLEKILEDYKDNYLRKHLEMMASKIGLFELIEGDKKLILELESILPLTEVDMTLFFRELSSVNKTDASVEALEKIKISFYNFNTIESSVLEHWNTWLSLYLLRINKDQLIDKDRKTKMNQINPKYILRNYMNQLAIDAAEKEDYSILNELHVLLKNPYQEQPNMEKWYAKRPDWARNKVGCSALSCSS